MTAPLLEVTGVGKRFGSLTVLHDVSFALAPGEALGIVGPNGAGKSTLLNVVAGTLPPDGGRVVLDGQDVTGTGAAARCRGGIGRSYQVPRPFSGMTVFENTLVAASFGAGLRSRAAADAAFAALVTAGLDHHADTPAGSLRLLDRKRLELARALATDPRVVLLDEIAGGLTEAEVPALVETIQQLVREGVAVVWIEHVVHALVAVVTRLMCLTYGEVLAVGEPRAVLADPRVVEVYLGSTIAGDEPELGETA
ncbi:ABC transporter ATP-binding protein [Klenkia brasiliensis]|uniref:Branched-chain amino acid transport system ATP-binding protein n=1 Tax=Klenkia brasiliensis TaxID=333142 RepID=A0A1G7WFA3_9ACTN|nr:ATP-binding cassette domain-containing protein [Klenkia brasiliensis]SDG70687.1 branched-chain amino acid transport system ATP-binding protein [Klenkia brasiliensis]